MKSKILVIDTEQYAGNFEREMCAYITGRFGECGVGDDISEEYSSYIKHSSWWTDHVVLESDDGCYRPVSIYPTIGWFNNGLGGHYKDIPENEAIAIEAAVSFMVNYNKSRIEKIRNRLENKDFEDTKNGWTKQACEREIKKYEDDIKGAYKLKKYPAYMSVAIFVDEFPPKEVWEEFTQRAKEFSNKYAKITGNSYSKESIKVTGFRQINPNK